VSCAICEKRKEKRFCPAVHGRICPQCCGEQREVTLDCPSECVYLQQAREHEKPRGMSDVNPADLFLPVEVGDEFLYQREHLIMGLTFALARSVRADRTLKDADLIAAVSSLAKTFETLVNSGLHYETPISNVAQQAVAAEVQTILQEFREAEQKLVDPEEIGERDVVVDEDDDFLFIVDAGDGLIVAGAEATPVLKKNQRFNAEGGIGAQAASERRLLEKAGLVMTRGGYDGDRQHGILTRQSVRAAVASPRPHYETSASLRESCRTPRRETFPNACVKTSAQV